MTALKIWPLKILVSLLIKTINSYRFLQGVGVYDGEYLSEDYYVCRVLRELGFEVHVDVSCQTKHNGVFSF